MSTDRITTLLGVLLGALHQVGLVGAVPQTRADFFNTLASAGMIVLGYFINKQ